MGFIADLLSATPGSRGISTMSAAERAAGEAMTRRVTLPVSRAGALYIPLAVTLYNGILSTERHYMTQVMLRLRERLNLSGNHTELLPLFNQQSNIQTADNTGSLTLPPNTPPPSFPVAPNFLAGAPSLPGTPPATPPITHPSPPIVAEAISWTWRTALASAAMTDFTSTESPDLVRSNLGLDAGPAPPNSPRPNYLFKGNDRAMCRLALHVLRAIIARDLIAANDKPTTAISNRAPIIDPNDQSQVDALWLVVNQLEYLLSVEVG